MNRNNGFNIFGFRLLIEYITFFYLSLLYGGNGSSSGGGGGV